MSITKYGNMYATNNPKNVVVFTNEKYLNKNTARVVSRKVLLNRVSKKCSYFQSGDCRSCETETEKEIDCYTAWQLTVGKGKKLY